MARLAFVTSGTCRPSDCRAADPPFELERGIDVPSKTKDPQPMSDEAIRTRAYLMWEADGRPDGMADHYWMRAAAPDEAVHDAVAETASKVSKATKPKAEAKPKTEAKPKPETKANKAAPAKSAVAKLKAAVAKVSAPPVKAKAASKPPSKKAAKKD